MYVNLVSSILAIYFKANLKQHHSIHKEFSIYACHTGTQFYNKRKNIFQSTLIGEGNVNILQYSCLENAMGRGAWQVTVHGIARVGHNVVTKPP